MTKEKKVVIFEFLFIEGIMTAHKVAHMASHEEPADSVPNLHVRKALQSFRSRGLMTGACVEAVLSYQ